MDVGANYPESDGRFAGKPPSPQKKKYLFAWSGNLQEKKLFSGTVMVNTCAGIITSHALSLKAFQLIGKITCLIYIWERALVPDLSLLDPKPMPQTFLLPPGSLNEKGEAKSRRRCHMFASDVFH